MFDLVAALLVNRKRRRRKERKTRDTSVPADGDLRVPAGDFLVCETGVTAKLKPPLEMMSNHYRWEKVPPSIAALKLVVMNNDLDNGRVASFVYSMMSESQKAMLDASIGKVVWTCEEHHIQNCEIDGHGPGGEYEHSSDLVESVEKIWDWMPSLASRCPYKSVAHDLVHIREMCDESLDDYVMRRLI